MENVLFIKKFEETQKVLYQYPFVLFILVGIINTLFGYGVFCLFIWLNFHYTLALLITTCIGVLFNFKTIGTVVFKSSDNGMILKFFMVYAIAYVVNVGIIHLESYWLDNMYMKGLIGTFFTALLSYNLNKTFVFRKKV